MKAVLLYLWQYLWLTFRRCLSKYGPSCSCPLSTYSIVPGSWSAVFTLEPRSRRKFLNTLLQILGDCFLKHTYKHHRALSVFSVSHRFTVIHFVVTHVSKRHVFNKTNTRNGTRETHTTLTCLPVTVIIYLIILSLLELTIISVKWW
jgi:hypothetical protein